MVVEEDMITTIEVGEDVKVTGASDSNTVSDAELIRAVPISLAVDKAVWASYTGTNETFQASTPISPCTPGIGIRAFLSHSWNDPGLVAKGLDPGACKRRTLLWFTTVYKTIFYTTALYVAYGIIAYLTLGPTSEYVLAMTPIPFVTALIVSFEINYGAKKPYSVWVDLVGVGRSNQRRNG
ncbi:hypothetical protein CYMTET_22668 [Cymbomonas tetramitiformis]|uniref:Uncharacterized protein n=1 Tax=Cymbomonas tetramitiformis TaxID=36881 RepID=A0AAE0G0A2_9CHLO|nr:hypothetical protein CYMTET_22668 [Cymbomonas tetramitiformis]